ncbi:hypothetical protein ROZALSC1DRAFT_26947, partial [Rozella allomycis CSF55]
MNDGNNDNSTQNPQNAEEFSHMIKKWSRIKDEDEKDNSALTNLLNLMDDYPPLIPDAVTDFYLMKSGVQLEDVRLKRLLAITAQKFISDIATDAMQYNRLRQHGGQKDKRRVSLVALF